MGGGRRVGGHFATVNHGRGCKGVDLIPRPWRGLQEGGSHSQAIEGGSHPQAIEGGSHPQAIEGGSHPRAIEGGSHPQSI